MRILVTGSSGHLGEALVRVLRERGDEVIGLDVTPGTSTTVVGSIADRAIVEQCITGVETVFHAATLHKPHVATHTRQDFVDVNISGTLNLLESAAKAGVESFVYTSTTSVFGDALRPPDAAPAVWVTEVLRPIPRNIYGVTKEAAENLCQLFHRNQGLPCVVLRTSRFFPEADDNPVARKAWDDANLKANELLFRRVDIADVVEAHLLAARRAPGIGFGRYIVSATTPFRPEDVEELRSAAPAVARRRVPEYEVVYERLGWRMLPSIDRIYDNTRARRDLGWQPRYNFDHVIDRLRAGEDIRSPLAIAIGAKGYHAETFAGEPYPVE